MMQSTQKSFQIDDSVLTPVDDKSVLTSADFLHLAASSKSRPRRAILARETEAAAREFIVARSERTAMNLLGSAIAFHRYAPSSISGEHLVCVAAAHLASSDHPMAVEMAKVPPLDKSDEGMTVPAIIQVWDTWMALHADINRSAYRM